MRLDKKENLYIFHTDKRMGTLFGFPMGFFHPGVP